MNVHQSAIKLCNKRRRKNSHEAGQNDQIGCASVNAFSQCSIKFLAAGELFVIDTVILDAGLARALQAKGIGAIADDQYDISLELAVFAGVD